MSLVALLKKLGSEHGIELDDDELEGMGLSADEERPDPSDDPMEVVLSGEAAGAAELFISEPRSWLATASTESDGLMWEPIIREGQWAVRPGAAGQKRRTPLKVVAGHSTDQRKEIGLADLIEAFNFPAVDHVTVPTSHQNDVTQNTGFIKALKLVNGEYKPKGSKTKKKVKVLMGGYDIKLPDIKEKMQLGAIASRSAGLLYDYVDTESGKTWPVVLEHVALTNKPWITGMKSFGRKLVKSVKSTVGLSLSDEQPDDEDLLAMEDALESIELADTSITWDKEDDPDWLRSQVTKQLDEARAQKISALPRGNGMYVEYDYPPRYRCAKARPGLALISDGWGDECNYWTAPFKIVKGEVEVETDYTKWTATKRAYIPDPTRNEFEPGEEPLEDEDVVEAPPVQLSRLQLAQRARKARASGESAPIVQENTTPSRGGEHMAGEDGTLQLSEEARKAIKAAEDRATAAEVQAKKSEDRADKLSDQIERLAGPVREAGVDGYISELKAMGLDEAHGFTGVLAEVRAQMLADDGEPAIQGEHFSDEKNTEGTLSLSEAIKRIFGAFEKAEDGKAKLGTQLSQPSESSETLGEDGKPAKTDPVEEAEKDFSQLSEEEQELELVLDNPVLARTLGLTEKVKAHKEAQAAAEAAKTNGGGA